MPPRRKRQFSHVSDSRQTPTTVACGCGCHKKRSSLQETRALLQTQKRKGRSKVLLYSNQPLLAMMEVMAMRLYGYRFPLPQLNFSEMIHVSLSHSSLYMKSLTEVHGEELVPAVQMKKHTKRGLLAHSHPPVPGIFNDCVYCVTFGNIIKS